MERLNSNVNELKDNYDGSVESIENAINLNSQFAIKLKNLNESVPKLNSDSKKLLHDVLNAKEALESYEDLDLCNTSFLIYIKK